jgi:hypothetical protein
MFTQTIDFNRKAVEYAERMELPMVGNSDTHRIRQLGSAYTLVEAEKKTVESVFEAVRAGRTQVVSAPLEPLAGLRKMIERRSEPLRRFFEGSA